MRGLARLCLALAAGPSRRHALLLLLPAPENVVLEFAELLQHHAAPLQVAVAAAGEPAGDAAGGDSLLVDADHLADGPFVYVQRGQVRQEVVACEKAEEHKVVYDRLLVVREAEWHGAELFVQVLAHYVHLDQFEGRAADGRALFIRLAQANHILVLLVLLLELLC